MTISDQSRKLMAHSALDSFDVQESKRLWWSLFNHGRTYDFLDDDGNISRLMRDLEAIVTAIQNGE